MNEGESRNRFVGGLWARKTRLFAVGIVGAAAVGGSVGSLCFAGDDAFSPFVGERLEDPVEWVAWSPTSPRRSAELGKPTILTISHEINGRSFAMAEETFRNVDIAGKINKDFTLWAIDRTEYPIVAEFWSAFARNSKRIKGWPLTVFATPELHPIDGGGYYPPTDDWGSQGFVSVVNGVGEQWEKDERRVAAKARGNLEQLSLYYGEGSLGSLVVFKKSWIGLAIENMSNQFEYELGGFTMAPKDVSFDRIGFLDAEVSIGGSHAEIARKMRDLMLDGILGAGMRDFVRGGFYTSSVDEAWALPDFRKSAVEQANAIEVFHRNPIYAKLLNELGECLISEFRMENGLYSDRVALLSGPTKLSEEIASAIANTWTFEDLQSILSPMELSAMLDTFDIGIDGNTSAVQDVVGAYAGRNVIRPKIKDRLIDLKEPEKSAVAALNRNSQSRHFLKKELIASLGTNALIASALLKIEGNDGERFVSEARSILGLLWGIHFDSKNKRLFSSSRNSKCGRGEASSKGYALLISALLDFHGQTREALFLDRALRLQAIMDDRFASEEGPYWIAPKGMSTSDIPMNLLAFIEDEFGSANALQLTNLARFARLVDDANYRVRANNILQRIPEDASYAPEAYIGLLRSALAVVGN